jgi:DNA-binding GntR family transcriptional regulator
VAPDSAAQDQLYARLKSDLLSGLFAPGARIEILQLADRFGVSATPVREAIHRLYGERLVEPHPVSGFRIATLNQGQLLELYAWNVHHILAALHLATEDGLRRALNPILGTRIPEMPGARVSLLNQFFEAIGRATANGEFHGQIAAANERLAAIRLAEAGYFKNMGAELARLLMPVEMNVHSNLRRRIWHYHRRRFEHVSALARKIDPLQLGY